VQLNNPKDPILKTGPEVEQKLFEAMGKLASGHDHAVVAGATINLLVNLVRQNCATRQEAERAYDELVGRAKNLLLEKHYDPVTNKRRNIFPFTQVVQAELVRWGDNV